MSLFFDRFRLLRPIWRRSLVLDLSDSLTTSTGSRRRRVWNLRRALGGMLSISKVSPDGRNFGSKLQNVIIKVLFVVNLVNHLVNARRWLRSTSSCDLRANHLSIVDNQFFVKGCCSGQLGYVSLGENVPNFCISMVRAASTSLIKSTRAATACGREVDTNSLR